MIEVATDHGRGPVVLVHGGAGARVAEGAAMAVGCRAAAASGLAALQLGATAIEAAVAAVEVLEDDPRFNAGTGAALTTRRTIELDASVMEGTGLRAGGVCALPPFLHPVAVALALLRDGRAVLLAADGAAAFAEEAGFRRSTIEAMTTERALAVLERVEGEGGEPDRLDTVGAVVLDEAGATAVATSTGGVVGQPPGRVGDSPIVGVGGHARDGAGAVSTTGRGEVLLRAGTARTVADVLRAGGSASSAARAGLEELTGPLDGPAGVIVVDREGRIVAARNTPAMPWAAARSDGTVTAGH